MSGHDKRNRVSSSFIRAVPSGEQIRLEYRLEMQAASPSLRVACPLQPSDPTKPLTMAACMTLIELMSASRQLQLTISVHVFLSGSGAIVQCLNYAIYLMQVLLGFVHAIAIGSKPDRAASGNILL